VKENIKSSSKRMSSNKQSGVAAIRVGDCDMPVPSTPEEFRILLEDPYVMRVESLGAIEVPRVFLPRTLLGDYVDLYLYWVFCEKEEAGCGSPSYCATKELKGAIAGLVKFGGRDIVAPFFEPLDTPFSRSLSFFRGHSTYGMMMAMHFKDKPGMSAIQSMEIFPRGASKELKWLIGKLKSKYNVE
jgi:hypothetical protein